MGIISHYQKWDFLPYINMGLFPPQSEWEYLSMGAFSRNENERIFKHYFLCFYLHNNVFEDHTNNFLA
jgi:hypothetical protein